MTNKKRLIFLDEALSATHNELFWTESEAAAVRAFLIKQPTVDAVEVVRCRDCLFGKGEVICTNPKCTKSYYGCPVPPDHFCSYGERREGE